MQFYGIQKSTLLDYPGEVGSTLFVFGCNFRCPYCHNPELVCNSSNLSPIDWDEIFTYLQKRKNVLGGVCITGGEPLLQRDLPDVIKQIHFLGLKVKIDTNGTRPDMLEKLDLDFIAMDIKTSLSKYHLIGYTGKDDLPQLVKKSIDWIINSNIPHEFRTTVAPNIVTIDDIKNITHLIKGANKYILAQFRPLNTLNPDWGKVEPYSISVLNEMKKIVQDAGINCEIRAGY